MSLIEFKNLPDTTTPINAANLNYNFNELSNQIANLNLILNEKIKNLEGNVGWINPSPLNSFSNQSINLSTDDYDMFEVIYMLTTYGGYRYRMTTGKLPSEVGEKFDLESVNYDGNRGVVAYNRAITQASKTSFSFTDCERYYDIGTQVDNTYLVPLYVILYKTALLK